jgi:hypothetical protein
MQILVARGVDMQAADGMVNSYVKKSLQAKREQLAPAPTFRDLLNVADDYIKGKELSQTVLPLPDQSAVTVVPRPEEIKKYLQHTILGDNKNLVVDAKGADKKIITVNPRKF